MTRLVGAFSAFRESRYGRILVDLLLIAAGLADALLGLVSATGLETTLAVVAAAGIALRRRFPYVAFALALPGLFFASAVVAALITLYSVAAYTRHLLITVIASIIVFAGYVTIALYPGDLAGSVLVTIYGLLFALGPLALGLLTATRRTLTRSLEELSGARDEERRLAASEALGRERAVLAREMHDVVSHQISLIAVQAGALQMRAADDQTREAARTIRTLSVETLDELRSMVMVLRLAGGDARSLLPQFGLAELPTLIEHSGLNVTTDLQPIPGLSTSAQRTLYRAVQEGLTNARKHAAGAPVWISLHHDDGWTTLRVRTGPPELPVLGLPSAGVGLQGLRERAELLGGTTTSAHITEGGFETVLRFPITHGHR